MGQVKHFFAGRYGPMQADPVMEAIAYDAHAEDRWENTLISMMPVNIQLDAGIGLVLVFLDDLEGDIDLPARYLLLFHPTDSPHYRLLVSEGERYLYERY